MRVLHIGKYYPPFSGGIENFMGDLLPCHARSGLKVCTLVHNHDPSITRTQIETREGVLIYRVPCHGNLLYAPVSPLFPIVLVQALKAFKPDIIHLHMPNTSAFWTLFIPAIKKIPMVVHWHSDVVQSGIDTRLKIAYSFYKPFEQALLKRSVAVIATSFPYMDTSPALKNWLKKTFVIPLGIKNSRVHVSGKIREWAEKTWGDSKTRFLCVGRLTYYKGHDKLVRAIAKIPEARVIIVGKGELKNSLKKIILELGIEKQVTLIGYLEEEKLEALLSSSHCLVLPSIERTEAFGVVLLEAMRAGKSSIIFNIKGSGTTWVVKDKITGLCVPLNNESRLIHSIQTLAANPGVFRVMGENARQRFQTKYDITRIADSFITLYERSVNVFKRRDLDGNI